MGISLPLVLYAASKAYRTQQDKKDRQARLEAESTITNFGFRLDDSGNRIGGMMQLSPTDTNVELTHFRRGSGNLQEIQARQSILPYYINTVTGKKGTASDFERLGEDVIGDSGNYRVIGQNIGGKIELFPSWDKGLKLTKGPEDYTAQFYLDAKENKFDTLDALLKALAQERKTNPDTPLFAQRVIPKTDADGHTTFTYSTVDKTTFDAIGTVANSDKIAVTLKARDPKFANLSVPASNPRNELNAVTTMISQFFQDNRESGATGTDFAAKFHQDSYTNFLDYLSRTILDKRDNLSKDNLAEVNSFIESSPEQFLSERYSVLARLPGMTQTFRSALGQSEAGARDAIINKIYEENGGPENVHITQVKTPMEVPDGDGGAQESTVVTILPQPAKYANFASSMEAAINPNGTANAKKDLREFIDQVVFDYNKVKRIGKDGVEVTEQQMKQDQPKVDFFLSLKGSQYAGGKTGLDVLTSAFNLQKATLSGVQQDVVVEYLNAIPEMEEAIKGIAAMTSNRGSMSAKIAFKKSIGDDFDKFVAAEAQRVAALDSAIKSISNFKDTLRDDNGKLIPFGSAQGQIFLTLEGMKYFVSRSAPELVKRFTGMGAKEFTTGADRLYTNTSRDLFANSEYKIPGGFKLWRNADRATIAKLAAEKGMTVQEYKSANEAARKELQSMFEKETQTSNAAIKSNLVMRSYYKFTSAYLLAAAIQGGTGGRTISDQDVLNILKAFGDDAFFQEPELQEKLLNSIVEDLQTQLVYSNIIANGSDSEKFAALKYSSLLSSTGVRNSLNLTLADVIDRTGFASLEEEDVDLQGEFNGFTMEQIVNKMNRTRLQIGERDEPYTSQNVSTSDLEFKNALNDLITQRNRRK